MSIEMIWENDEKTLARHLYHQGWTLDDYEQIKQTFHAEISEFDHPVYLISDLSQASTLPVNVMSKRNKIEEIVTHNLALNIVVGTSPVARATLQMMLKVTKAFNQESHVADHIRFADTLEEARTLIARAQAEQAGVN